MEHIISSGKQAIARQYQINFIISLKKQLTAECKYHVRYLKHTLERGVILSFGKIGVKFERRAISNQIHQTLG